MKKLIRNSAKAIDDRLFNDAFRRAVVHGKELRNVSATGRIGRTVEALRRERTVSREDVVVLPDAGRFVGGIAGRSGTTWVTRLMRHALFDSHAVIGEQGLFVLSILRSAPYEYYQFGGSQRGRERYLRYFRSNLEAWGYKRRCVYGSGLKGLMRYIPKRAIEIAYDELQRELVGLERLPEITRAFGVFYLRLLNYHAAVAFGSPHPWVSKEPPYGRHAGELFAMVPGARLVVMARDGREIALSMYKRGWTETIRGSMQRWAAFAEMTLNAMEEIPQDRARLFRYDDVVTNFEEEITALFSHLDLPAPDVGAILNSGNKNLIPRSGSLGAWQSEISKADLDWFDHEYGSIMDRLGYRR